MEQRDFRKFKGRFIIKVLKKYLNLGLFIFFRAFCSAALPATSARMAKKSYRFRYFLRTFNMNQPLCIQEIWTYVYRRNENILFQNDEVIAYDKAYFLFGGKVDARPKNYKWTKKGFPKLFHLQLPIFFFGGRVNQSRLNFPKTIIF